MYEVSPDGSLAQNWNVQRSDRDFFLPGSSSTEAHADPQSLCNPPSSVNPSTGPQSIVPPDAGPAPGAKRPFLGCKLSIGKKTKAYREGKNRGRIQKCSTRRKTSSPGVASPVGSSGYTLGRPPPGQLRETGLIKTPFTAADATTEHSHDNTREMQMHATAGPSALQAFTKDGDDSETAEKERVESSAGLTKSCRQSALNLPSHEKLLKIRRSFIEGISGPVLKSLLDKLLEKKVLTDSERESADEMRNKRDKARFVIDIVRRKGEAASSEMVEFLCEVDPFLCEHLGEMNKKVGLPGKF
uniref:CARD domain-containing protein n=1 Tax=Sparus aurata TaxID=8175 RepID=A0A671XAI6_SPAAU